MTTPDYPISEPPASDIRTRERALDEKGRTLPEDMTDRELAEEAVRSLRAVGDAFELFSAELAKGGIVGMMRAFMTGGK